jgi:NAD(P)-dependent dehydrogenase (short-subunit alcohol dehydrogenase family)
VIQAYANPLSLFDVRGKVAIVTGASGAFGALAAEALAAALSRCHAKSASGLGLTDFQAAATASRHVVIAAARSTR